MVPLPVTFADVTAAMPRVRAVLRATPLYEYSGLSQLIGCRYFVKHENHQPVGAFKIRGGINLVATLTEAEQKAGILGCSTGNHGQSLAYAARRQGIACTIVVPVGTNPSKVRAIQHLGATVVELGKDFDEAREFLERDFLGSGMRYVHSANEPKLIAGVGSMAMEILADLPDVDVILVPIGLGSGVSATCLVAKQLRPKVKVIGVQAEGACAVADAWKNRHFEAGTTCSTWAEGVATRVPAQMTMEIMHKLLDDVILVSDDEMRRAVYWLMEHAHQIAEGAGAATLAAAFRERSRFPGMKVVGVLSGGNLDMAEMPRIMALGVAS